MLISKIIAMGSNPIFPEKKNKRICSLMVEHTAHNGKNIGSNPIILKLVPFFKNLNFFAYIKIRYSTPN